MTFLDLVLESLSRVKLLSVGARARWKVISRNEPNGNLKLSSLITCLLADSLYVSILAPVPLVEPVGPLRSQISQVPAGKHRW